jgi:hypothetical protein
MPSTSEVSLESTFSDLAYARLQDKAAPLLDYLLGFQMLKSDEDGSRAVGIFGFEVDGAIYYTPMFFLNGEVKGPDSIYSEKADLFSPLSEEWINTIVNRYAPRVGETDTRDRNARGARVPNYTRLNQIPGGLNKVSSDLLSVREHNDLPDFASAVRSLGISQSFLECCERHPKLAEAVSKFYDMQDFLPDIVLTKQAAAAEKKLILINSVAQEGVDQLTDAQRDEVLAGGVAVIDKRPDTARSILYTTETSHNFETPTGGGLYDIVMSDGSVQPMLIGVPSGTVSNLMGEGVVFAMTDDGKRCGFVNRTKVFSRRKYQDLEYRKALEKVSDDISKIANRDVVVFMSVTGESTSPVRIVNIIDSVDGSTVFKVEPWYMGQPRNPRNTNRVYRSQREIYSVGMSDVYPDVADRIDEVVVNVTGGHTARMYKHKMVVGERYFRAIKVDKYKPSDFSVPATVGEPSSDQLCDTDFGDPSTIIRTLEKVAAPLKVWKDGPEIVIRDQFGTKSLNKVAAIEYLLTQHQLGAADAKLVVKTASATPYQYRVKYAAELLNIPDINDTSAQGGFMNAYVPEQVPVGVENRATTPSNHDFYRYVSPFAGGEDEPSSVDVVSNASQTGQKDVFDAAGLSALIKAQAPTELVERYLPTMVAGMDKLGRLLFLVYWHYDEFEERYGERDLSEFVDQLRDTFNHLGETVLFLKTRTINSGQDFFGLGVSQAN